MHQEYLGHLERGNELRDECENINICHSGQCCCTLHPQSIFSDVPNLWISKELMVMSGKAMGFGLLGESWCRKSSGGNGLKRSGIVGVENFKEHGHCCFPQCSARKKPQFVF